MKKKVIIVGFTVIALIVLIGFLYLTKSYPGSSSMRIYIPRNSTESSIRDSLLSKLGPSLGNNVFIIWNQLSKDITLSYGSYIVNPADKAYQIANKIAKGRQTPVRLTINVARTYDDLLKSISSGLDMSTSEVDNVVDSILQVTTDFPNRPTYIAAFVPDTYEFYWNDTPQHVVKTLFYYRNKFWDEDRQKKAKALGLTPIEVVTLASIVEEESNKKDEQPKIARLYLNRLKNGMKLQADPTVKFAVGDYTIRRISKNHLEVSSPYNTYKIDGLPPGPIRLPQKSTIDAVLNAPANNYLYMCAKEDFSGYHNFTNNYSTHLENAKRYQKALNAKGIK